jgi:aryl-alcohol dehydrogenase-like predicted oxidoreductase
MSSRTLFGAAALSSVGQEEADRTMSLLKTYGVNHIDTAASYGEAELRLGPWMERERDRYFLATKTGERRYRPALDEIRRSLQRLRVEQVDLIQLHNLVDEAEWEIAMGPGGALEAAIQAREEGLARFIGVTGHGVQVAKMHLRSLEHFDFDSVLLPYSYIMMQNEQYAADFEALMDVCRARNVAVQTIKAVVRRPYGEREATHATWYEPLVEQKAIDREVHWVLGRPGLFLNTVGDTSVLPMVLDAAERFEQRTADEEMEAAHVRLGMKPLFPQNEG